MIETRLIAGNAGIDLVSTASRRLVHKLAVSQHGSGHRHEIRISPFQHFLGHLWHVYPVRGDDRDTDFFSDSRSDTSKRSSGHHRGNGWDIRLVPNKVR